LRFTVRSLASVALLLAAGCSTDTTPKPAPLEAGLPPADAAAEAATPAALPDAARDASETPPAEASVPDASPDTGPVADAAPPSGPYPARLSQTGLFSDIRADALGEGVRAYAPRYALWSDGATKRRWLKLPAGKKIDTSDMDFWTYPVGTRAWKEFTRDGKRIETRMLFKAGEDALRWVMIAYLWRDDQSDADAVPDGVENAKGTEHDVPKQADCNVCHRGMKDRLLGVSALQLSHAGPGVTLSTLNQEGSLSHPLDVAALAGGAFRIPGAPMAEEALGYLHANCGFCHNPTSPVSASVHVDFWESTTALGRVEDTTAYRSTVLQHNAYLPALHVIEPGRPDQSEMFLRLSRRGVGQMPPLGTELVDSAGVAKVRAFIESMPVVDGGTGGTGDAGPDSGLD
jgi:hypothetical protein